MRRLALLVLLVALPATLLPPPAASQVATFDAANYVEQIRQFVQMLIDYYLQYESLVQQIEQLVQLVDQVEMMEQDLEALGDLDFDNPGRFLADLGHVLRVLQGVVYRADDVLRRYDDVYTPAVALDLPAEEDERLAQTLGTFRTLLAAAQETARHSDDAAHRLGELTRQLDRAEGNLEALQAVGALTTQVATEATRLAEVQAMSLNALTVYYSHRLAEREAAEQTFLDWVHRGRFYAAGPRPRTFGLVPADFRSAR